ncbi:hypothetical protein AB1E18_005292 [Capra hircus]
MAQAFVNSKIQPGKVVVFIKPTCPYCRKTQELLSQLPFKQGLLEFVDITAASNTSEIQDYLEQLTGARTVPRVFIANWSPAIITEQTQADIPLGDRMALQIMTAVPGGWPWGDCTQLQQLFTEIC